MHWHASSAAFRVVQRYAVNPRGAKVALAFTTFSFLFQKTSLEGTVSSSTSPAPPPKYKWLSASSFTQGELEETVTSTFVALIYVPKATPKDGLALGRKQKGFAFRIGDTTEKEGGPPPAAAASSQAPTNEVTHFRNMRATVPRILVMFHVRGGLELPGGGRNPGELLPHAAMRELMEETGIDLQHSNPYPSCDGDDDVGGGETTGAFFCHRLSPITYKDAVLVKAIEQASSTTIAPIGQRKNLSPKWLVFAKVTNNEAEFESLFGATFPENSILTKSRSSNSSNSSNNTPLGDHLPPPRHLIPVVTKGSAYLVESLGSLGIPIYIEGKMRGLPRSLASSSPWQAEMILATLFQTKVLTEEEAMVIAIATEAFAATGGPRQRLPGQEIIPLPALLQSNCL